MPLEACPENSCLADHGTWQTLDRDDKISVKYTYFTRAGVSGPVNMKVK